MNHELVVYPPANLATEPTAVADARLMEGMVYEGVPAYAQSPLRGAAAWSDLRSLMDLGLPADPRVLHWVAAAHELAHLFFLRLPDPKLWSQQRVNDRLMALSQRTRIDHEMRAVLVQHLVVEKFTGVRALGERGNARQAAYQGIAVLTLERHYGGDVTKIAAMARAVSSGGLREELEDFYPRARRRVERLLRAHDIRADARSVVAMIEAARATLWERTKREPASVAPTRG